MACTFLLADEWQMSCVCMRLCMRMPACVCVCVCAQGVSVCVYTGKWKPSQTDVNGMINSTVIETGGTLCVVIDMGAYHLAEFAKTLCRPYVGSAVHGGIHILQVVSRKLQPRTLTFPTFSTASKVC